MIGRHVLRLLILVSCAHALVHGFELALPSAELRLQTDYQVNKSVIGVLAAAWRLPFGLGALLAGVLVDRFGSQRMLTLYLLGCAACCFAVSLQPPLPLLFVAMFAMGSCASIYHPAGLALISHETTAANRPRALGLHGIFGSAGIGSAPFLAGLLFSLGASWRQYFGLLGVIGAALGGVFLAKSWRQPRTVAESLDSPATDAEQDYADWLAYFTLTSLAFLQGFIYSAVLTFLPRYLSDWQGPLIRLPAASVGGYLSAGVLLLGCFGQYLAGRIARPNALEKQLTCICLANIPFLIWMAVAADSRPLAAGCFALVHFMHQPIYNSLIAKYTPRRRRSACYGFSFAMGLGIGGLGAAFGGFSSSNLTTYLPLAAIAASSGLLGMGLWRREITRQRAQTDDSRPVA